jgi:alpha-L-rhamnosidase
MLGQFMEWLYADLVGLAPDPDAPGFARVRIRPQPVSGITWARAAHESPRGRVSVAWRHQGDTFTLDAELPVNAAAEVWLPASEVSSIREGGRPLAQASGVRVVRQQGDRTVLEIGSGRYALSSSWRQPTSR